MHSTIVYWNHISPFTGTHPSMNWLSPITGSWLFAVDERYMTPIRLISEDCGRKIMYPCGVIDFFYSPLSFRTDRRVTTQLFHEHQNRYHVFGGANIEGRHRRSDRRLPPWTPHTWPDTDGREREKWIPHSPKLWSSRSIWYRKWIRIKIVNRYSIPTLSLV